MLDLGIFITSLRYHFFYRLRNILLRQNLPWQNVSQIFPLKTVYQTKVVEPYWRGNKGFAVVDGIRDLLGGSLSKDSFYFIMFIQGFIWYHLMIQYEDVADETCVVILPEVTFRSAEDASECCVVLAPHG